MNSFKLLIILFYGTLIKDFYALECYNCHSRFTDEHEVSCFNPHESFIQDCNETLGEDVDQVCTWGVIQAGETIQEVNRGCILKDDSKIFDCLERDDVDLGINWTRCVCDKNRCNSAVFDKPRAEDVTVNESDNEVDNLTIYIILITIGLAMSLLTILFCGFGWTYGRKQYLKKMDEKRDKERLAEILSKQQVDHHKQTETETESEIEVEKKVKTENDRKHSNKSNQSEEFRRTSSDQSDKKTGSNSSIKSNSSRKSQKSQKGN